MKAVTQKEVTRWVRQALRLRGIQTVRFAPNDFGLLNVPAKYCAIIGDLTTAMNYLAAGDGLPEFIEQPTSKRKAAE